MNYSWPLNDNFFTFKDRLKIALFYLNKKNRWTQGKYVAALEKEMAYFCQAEHAVYVSSGSTANTILAYYLKDNFYSNEKKEILLPSVTWQTSCSPFIREGFKPVFIDVSLTDFAIDLNKVEKYLDINHHKVACVFITSLLGFCPDINKILEFKKKYPSIKFCLDNCESTFTQHVYWGEYKNISGLLTSTTSTYFGHLLQSIEGGFLFTNKEDEYKYFLMARNHGLVRSLTGYIPQREINNRVNNLVDSRFDFNILGNNFRNTESNALLGSLDLKRANKYSSHRVEIYKFFKKQLNNSLFIFPNEYADRIHVPFSLPIIFNPLAYKNITDIKRNAIEWCENNGIETRPIISGNLLRQTCYKEFGNPNLYENAEILHCNGFYVGLHIGVTEEMVLKLTNYLNAFKHE